MGSEIPKQFLEVNGKPIIAYTIERFEAHPAIDKIVVVCISGWESYVLRMTQERDYKKLCQVVTGGESALESIRKGVGAIPFSDDDILVIHDGVRPLVDDSSISAVIEDCREYGAAVSSVPLVEHIVMLGKRRTDVHYIPRENTFRTMTPQAYRFATINRALQKAEGKEVSQKASYIGTLMMDLGEPLCLSKGSDINIKITNPKDLIYFSQMIG